MARLRLQQVWDREKTKGFQKKLLRWFNLHKRDLPWRRNPTPYRVWISEVMLQQTQAQTVIPYYRRFLKRFPDIKSLARTSEDEILALWAGLGYYRRARNLHRAARQIVDYHAAMFPTEFEEILMLPGVGRYTAGAISSIAFNRPQPVVDGNIRRVISRLHGLIGRIPESHFWNQAAAWIPPGKAAAFNQAVMELGARICLPSQPLCLQCPVSYFCEAYRKGTQGKIPATRASRYAQAVELVTLVLEKDGKVLLTGQQAIDYIPGKWSLPSQLLLKHKLPLDTASNLSRRLLHHTITLQPGTPIRHSITYRRMLVHVFYGKVNCSVSSLELNDKFHWASRSSLKRLLTSSLFQKALHEVINK